MYLSPFNRLRTSTDAAHRDSCVRLKVRIISLHKHLSGIFSLEHHTQTPLLNVGQPYSSKESVGIHRPH